MKKLLLIGTGGTIASSKTEAGYRPARSVEQMLEYLPDELKSLRLAQLQLMSIDSTNMTPAGWQVIAQCIWERYGDYDGFVILHGTDTMAYTASALVYMLQNSEKPIVLTGSQIPMEEYGSDGKQNLIDAIRYSLLDGARGVNVVFAGKVITGSCASKVRTKSMDAFASVNAPVKAIIEETGFAQRCEPKFSQELIYAPQLDPKVAVLRLIPGMDGTILEQLEPTYDGLVLETFGCGGIPTTKEAGFEKALYRWKRAGKPVVACAQVPFEGVDLSRYEVGRHFLETEYVISAGNMTVEATTVKLMWALGQTKKLGTIAKYMKTPIEFDLQKLEE